MIAQTYAAATTPRYTSYPTAAEFHDGVGAEDAERWLAAIAPDETLSLYIHIPFCQSLCWYCGCHTSVPNSYVRAEAYLARLMEEIDQVAGRIAHHDGVVHCHFGGGTPTYLSADDFRLLASHLRRRFSFRRDAEFAVEIDPRTLDDERAEALADAGVGRASLGIQDFDPEVQRLIKRVQSVDAVEATIKRLSKLGINRLSFDLIYGLPGQTVGTVSASARQAIAFDPDRIAVFGYAHVPWFKKHQRAIDESRLPDMADRLMLRQAIDAELVSAGYCRIGFDHYAKADDPLSCAAASGQLQRNFQGYSDDPADVLLGFGASAISSFADGYVQNASDVGAWRRALRDGHLPVARGVCLTAQDKLRAAAIQRLMCNFTVDLDVLCRDHDVTEDSLDDAMPRLAPLERDGLVTIAGRCIEATEMGRNFIRNIAFCLDARSKPGAERHSRSA
ncbi:oxygen-independent coproporphyrinogen-III oxidase [alpha proteobacterium Q-1]|nr:oxygen-independent coproporphyrinogen-III oxidase [alpha proteobacterium Q-1]